MSYAFHTEYLWEPERFQALNALAVETFGIDFSGWVASGAADGAYRPYSFFDGGRCVSNVSSTRMVFRHNGETLTALQLGTVMTDPAFRGQGLAGELVERAIAGRPAPFCFLFAGETRWTFYEGHGFRHPDVLTAFANETLRGKTYENRRLDLSKTADLGILAKYMRAAAPQTEHMRLCGARSLAEFYVGGPYRKNAYYFPNCAAVLILEKDGKQADVVEAYASKPHDAAWFARRAWSVFPEAERVGFGFLPALGADKLEIGTEKGELMVRGDAPAGPLLIPYLART